jgi:transposase
MARSSLKSRKTELTLIFIDPKTPSILYLCDPHSSQPGGKSVSIDVVSNNARWFLYEQEVEPRAFGSNVGLVNPFSMKRFMDVKMSRAKTDRVDSYFIAEYGRQIFEGPLFRPKTEAQKQIEAKVKILEDFYKDLTRVKNQREALSLRPMKGLKKNLAYYDRVIEFLKEQIKELEKEIRRLCKEHFPEEYRLLKSMPGIGDRAILGILKGLRGRRR